MSSSIANPVMARESVGTSADQAYGLDYARWYDTFYSDKPYAEEAAFVDQCFQRFGHGPVRRIIEFACGTGSHAFALESLRYDVVATEISNAMLARAREKGMQQGSQVEFRRQDLCSVDVADGPFDAALCLFDAIGYLQTDDALLNALDGVARVLRPGGVFLFEFWHEAAMVSSYDPLRVRRWKLPQAELLRISRTEIDRASRLARVHYSIYELRVDGTYSAAEENHINRYFSVPEMSALLVSGGWVPLKMFAGFTDSEHIDERTWHVLAVACRP